MLESWMESRKTLINKEMDFWLLVCFCVCLGGRLEKKKHWALTELLTKDVDFQSELRTTSFQLFFDSHSNKNNLIFLCITQPPVGVESRTILYSSKIVYLQIHWFT